MAENNAHRFSPEEYLERYGISAYMRDVVTLLLENRPDDPLVFLSEYFKNVIQGSSLLVRSYRYIRLTKRNRTTFLDNLVNAYATIESQRGEFVEHEEYKELLKLLCSDFPDSIAEVIIRVLTVRGDTVSFQRFVCGVQAVLLYEEFLQSLESLFRSCDHSGTGAISTAALHAILQPFLTTGSVAGNAYDHACHAVDPTSPRTSPAVQKQSSGLEHDTILYYEYSHATKQLAFEPCSELCSPSKEQLLQALALVEQESGIDGRVTFEEFVLAVFRTTERELADAA